jgi:hypothetical protein
MIDDMVFYSLHRFESLFNDVAWASLLTRADELKEARDFRELHQMIGLLFPDVPTQVKLREKLRPTLARQYIRLAFEQLKADPLFQARVTPNCWKIPTRKGRVRTSCQICLWPGEVDSPLVQATCKKCLFHEDCETEWWDHFIANHGVKQASCPFCNTDLGIQGAMNAPISEENKTRSE